MKLVCSSDFSFFFFHSILFSFFFFSSDVQGQNGTWVKLSGTWSDPTNWLGGVVAGNGGVATFDVPYSTTTSNPSILSGSNPTLSGLNFTGARAYQLSSAGINLNSGSAFQLNVGQGSSALISNGLFGNISTFNIAGGGHLTIQQEKTFTATGGVHLIDTDLTLYSDSSLGNSSNSFNFDGGRLTVPFSGQVISSRAIGIGNNGAGITITSNSTASFNGSVSGNGMLKIRRLESTNVIAGGFIIGGDASGFTGAIVHESGGLFTIASNGRIGGSASFDIAGELVLDNSVVNNGNRIADGRNLVLRGSKVRLTGNSSGSSEELGNLTLTQGVSKVSVSATNVDSTLSFAGLQRENRASVIFDGTNFNPNSKRKPKGQILFNTSPGNLIGGGGLLNEVSKNISILPFAAGSLSPTSTSLDLVSWDRSSGKMHLLGSNNYSSLATTRSDHNAFVQVATVGIGGQKINALKIGGILFGRDPLKITSGAIVVSANSAINSPIDFGNAEGFVHTNSFSRTIDIHGVIAGTNGLTKSGAGSLRLNGNNTYTGITTINGGEVAVRGNISAGSPGAFGADNSDIVLNSNSMTDARTKISFLGGGVSTINRGFLINTGGTQSAALSSFTGTSVVLNGNIHVVNPNGNERSGSVSLEGSGGPMVINGVISGNGGVTGYGLTLNGNNTYSGGTNMIGSIKLGHDNGFGTGLVIMDGDLSASGGDRVIANDFLISGGRFEGADSITLSGTVFGGEFDISTTEGVSVTGSMSSLFLTKRGASNLTLTNTANIIRGDTTVLNGTLTLAGDAGISSGVLGSSSRVDVGSFGTIPTDNAKLLISGSHTLNKLIRTNAWGIVTIGGSNQTGNSSFDGTFQLNRPITFLTAAEGGSTTFNSLIFDSPPSTTGGIDKVGNGVVRLTNANTYSGGTIVTSGSLLINNTSGSGTGTGAVHVLQNGTLGGTGSMFGSVTVAGVLSPGDSNIESFSALLLTLNSTSRFVWEALDNSPTGADLMRATDFLTLNDGTLDLSQANLGAAHWALGSKLTLINYAGAARTSGFIGFVDDTIYTFGSRLWRFNYNDTTPGTNFATEATGAHNVTLTLVASSIPEPSALALAGPLLICLIGKRRRKSNSIGECQALVT